MFKSAVLLFSLLVSLSVAAFDDREFKTPEGEALYKDLIQGAALSGLPEPEYCRL